MGKELLSQGNAIRFGDRLAASSSFTSLFKDGMSLVEETAAYLDGEGREDARRLPRAAALSYASESMRLTTRLMQIASWLLLQRAVNEGEMTQVEASSDKRRTRIAWQGVPSPEATNAAMPADLVALIDASLRLQARIARLDKLLIEPMPVTEMSAPHPLEAQMVLLRDAFGATPRATG